MSLRHLGTFGVWVVSSSVVCAQTVTVLGGVGVSGGLGEDKVAPQALVLVDGTSGAWTVASRATFDAARKYTGHGWVAKAAVEVQHRVGGPWGLLVGAEYGYREAGLWAKQVVWVRAGVVYVPPATGDIVTVLVRVPTWTTANDTTHARIGQVEVRHRTGRWVWSVEYALVVFQRGAQTRWGGYGACRVGRIIGRRRLS